MPFTGTGATAIVKNDLTTIHQLPSLAIGAGFISPMI